MYLGAGGTPAVPVKSLSQLSRNRALQNTRALLLRGNGKYCQVSTHGAKLSHRRKA